MITKYSQQKVENLLSDLRKNGKSTSFVNRLLKDFRAFIYWMIKNNRLQQNPIRHIDTLDNTERYRIRRELNPQDISELILTTKGADKHHG